jgi:hypothetical protein
MSIDLKSCMENRRRTQPFCGDTVNSLAREENNFHWSTSYKWFLNKSVKKRKMEKLWTIGIVNVGCVPEVFEFKELVSWCA